MLDKLRRVGIVVLGEHAAPHRSSRRRTCCRGFGEWWRCSGTTLLGDVSRRAPRARAAAVPLGMEVIGIGWATGGMCSSPPRCANSGRACEQQGDLHRTLVANELSAIEGDLTERTAATAEDRRRGCGLGWSRWAAAWQSAARARAMARSRHPHQRSTGGGRRHATATSRSR